MTTVPNLLDQLLDTAIRESKGEGANHDFARAIRLALQGDLEATQTAIMHALLKTEASIEFDVHVTEEGEEFVVQNVRIQEERLEGFVTYKGETKFLFVPL